MPKIIRPSTSLSEQTARKIILDLLWDKFIKELLDAKLCASDKLYYIIGDKYGSQEEVDRYWFKWLKSKDYINT